MNVQQIIEADLTWTGCRFERGVRIETDGDGRIVAVGTGIGAPTVRLRDRAVLPGFVNVHSHAFQRGLRGLGERFPAGNGNFWTWRETMYELVRTMTADSMYEVSHGAFGEMRRAGITTVGEFHYLHHDASLEGYALDEAVLCAARDTGVRLVLLQCYYRMGGIGKALAGGQLHFRTDGTEEFWKQVDALEKLRDVKTQTIGIAPHSVRAVDRDDLVRLWSEAARRGMVVHMHVEEQRREIADCVGAYGKTPLALVNELLEPDAMFTAVHCTHTAPDDLARFAAAGGNVAICPLSEANLGDGIADVPHMLREGTHICIGTDSNARLCMTEELRFLEYVQRLARECRGVCTDVEGDVAPALLGMATRNGARSLGVKTGAIAPGMFADLMALDLTAASLAGWTVDSLLAAFLLGCGNDVIAATCIGGRWTDHG